MSGGLFFIHLFVFIMWGIEEDLYVEEKENLRGFLQNDACC
jgi:hypothetical protein